MKRLVNGVEMELADDAVVHPASDGRLYVTTPEGTFPAVAVRQGSKTLVSYQGRQFAVERINAAGGGAAAVASGDLRSPMAGVVVSVHVVVGDAVTANQKLAVLEAMKTHQPILAPFDGVVEEVKAVAGAQVGDAELLIRVKAS